MTSLVVRSVGLLACLALVVPARARADEYDPFRVPREEFAGRVHTIALEPMIVPADVEQADQVRRLFEEVFTRELAAKGYTVVPAQEFDRVWRGNSRRVGGAYDRVTGRPVKERWNVVRDLTLKELADQAHIDATMSTSIRLDEVGWQKRAFRTYFESLGAPLLYRGKPLVDMPQRVVGYRVGLTIRDLSDASLYTISMPYEWVRAYVYRSYEERPEAAVFRSVESRDAVVRDLLRALPHLAASAPR